MNTNNIDICIGQTINYNQMTTNSEQVAYLRNLNNINLIKQVLQGLPRGDVGCPRRTCGVVIQPLEDRVGGMSVGLSAVVAFVGAFLAGFCELVAFAGLGKFAAVALWAVDKIVLKEFYILLGGEYVFDFGQHLGAVGLEVCGAVGTFFLAVGFLLGLGLVATCLALGLEGVDFSLLVGGEVEALEGVDAGARGTGLYSLGALLVVGAGVGAVGGFLGEGAADAGGKNEGCNKVFFRLYVFRDCYFFSAFVDFDAFLALRFKTRLSFNLV